MALKIKIGCDPELFVKEGDKYISAHGLFPGTKSNPYKVDKGAVQVDGMALEFNIDPAETVEEFDKNIKTVLNQVRAMARKVDKGLKLDIVPVANFDNEYFFYQPVESKILGCDPDYNIRGDQNVSPNYLVETPVRTAAGHVHIGWTENESVDNPIHFEDCRYVAETFHHRSSLFAPKHRNEYERLRYYGNHGAFRPKSYGVELRSPSNLWIKSAASRKEVFNEVQIKMANLKRA